MAFATIDDLTARVGRDLASGEADTGTILLDFATALIAQIAGKSDEWATDLEDTDAIPPILHFICLEIAYRAFLNPTLAMRTQESLGAYSYSADYGRASDGLIVTDSETLLIRRAVWGRTSAGVPVGSIFKEAEDVVA